MERVTCDKIREELDHRAEGIGSQTPFPLDGVLACAREQSKERQTVGGVANHSVFGDLLTLFDVTSVSASRAIKLLAASGDDPTGIRDALVDLWGRSEAARCLLFDAQQVFTGTESQDRVADLKETARLLAPEAIAIALRLSAPVTQYVEFASKVAGH